TTTRYPPENMLNGPHSPATRPGSSCRMRLDRHVYQAGSRVGALIEGSRRNVHPNATSSSRIASTRSAGLPRNRLPGSGAGTTSWAGASLVTAIRVVLPLCRSTRAGLGEARESGQHRRGKRGREHRLVLVAGNRRVPVLERLLLRHARDELRYLLEGETVVPELLRVQPDLRGPDLLDERHAVVIVVERLADQRVDLVDVDHERAAHGRVPLGPVVGREGHDPPSLADHRVQERHPP